MDRLTAHDDKATFTSPLPDCAPALPDESRLAMPIQSLREAPSGPRLEQPARLLLRRGFVFGVAALLTAGAAYEMYRVLDVGGLTALEALVLGLFVLLFAWIGFSFSNALAGCVAMVRRRTVLGIDMRAPPPRLTIRVAIVMPAYNEPPSRAFAGLQATYESLLATGAMDAFDVFILSDTTHADVWIAEEAAFLTLRERVNARNLFYRRRPHNIDRKAGNIAEWVTRFGGAYDAMLVLDADSVMTGDCIVRLAAAMEQNPHVGLIQTLPVIAGGRSLFARLQQFAGRLYGPLVAEGLAWWHGPDSNYWGHNAIIRTRAFAASAGLPHLSGRKPFGGHILSHDFVEAALLRRGGWAVHLVPSLSGSYEEAPPSLIDLTLRDRRWCQGNLQHAAVLSTRGLHTISRLHLLMGIGSYITAPLWLALLLSGLLTALQARFVPPDYFPSEFSLFPTWPAQDPVRAAWVFTGTMAILLLPKLFAYGAMVLNRDTRREFRGGAAALVSVVAETIVAGLAAPVVMISQSAAVLGILAGRDSGWQPQRRSDGRIPVLATVQRYIPHTLVGIALAAAALVISLPLFFWMSPVILGLLLSIPIVLGTAQVAAGAAFARMGLLTTPEEIVLPAVLRRAAEIRALTTEDEPVEAVQRLAAMPGLLAAHRAMLPNKGEREPDDYTPDRFIARAKLDDVTTLANALAVLSPREKSAALADVHALDRLLSLASKPARDGAVPARSR